MSDRPLIAGAAQRLAGFCEAIVDAHVVHGISPGTIDDLASTEFQAAATPIYELTLSADYQRDIGAAFGGISALMDLYREAVGVGDAESAWEKVHRYFASAADELEPTWRDRVIDQPTLVRATSRTPSVMRFDLLAGLVTTDAALELIAATRQVIARVSAPSSPLIDLRVEDLPDRLLPD
ncbi:MAG: hypothetical protein ACE367_23760 [Acidimicrobiales bacterium]